MNYTNDLLSGIAYQIARQIVEDEADGEKLIDNKIGEWGSDSKVTKEELTKLVVTMVALLKR